MTCFGCLFHDACLKARNSLQGKLLQITPCLKSLERNAGQAVA
jgi:hypothetical protein